MIYFLKGFFLKNIFPYIISIQSSQDSRIGINENPDIMKWKKITILEDSPKFIEFDDSLDFL